MPKHRLPFGALSIALVVAACGSAASSAPPTGSTGSPGSSAAPSAQPSIEGIDHPIGATDVVLQLEEGGGFVPIDFLAGQAPAFTLFGDGRVVFQPMVDRFPQPGADGITRTIPWRTAQLDEGQIQELLTFAIEAGGLGAARDNYGHDGIADASSSNFTLNAGGLNKIVSVYALGIEDPNTPDLVARNAFKRLSDRLHDFDQRGTIATDVYVPTAYRGVIFERDPIPTPGSIEWPWPGVTVADFKSDVNGVGGAQLPHRTITVDEVAALKLGELPGGAQGVVLVSADGKNWTLTLRPLLPNEAE